MLLQDWMNKLGLYPKQAIFVREKLAGLFCSGCEYDVYKNVVQVIGTHHCGGFDLPVYSLSREDIGLRIILRDNSSNWKMSVISEKPVKADLSFISRSAKRPTKAQRDYCGDDLANCYFEGFPHDLIFGSLSENRNRFSICISSDNELWTALFLIMTSIGAIKRAKYTSEGEPD